MSQSVMMTTRRKVVFLIVVAFSIPIGLLVVYYNSMVFRVLKKPSPNGAYSAKLVGVRGFDVIFSLSIDGHEIYQSRDFAPVNADFQEQLSWDKSGNIVVLKVAGNRIFGYDALKKQPLTDSELLEVEFTPFDDLGFEGQLPKDRLSKVPAPDR